MIRNVNKFILIICTIILINLLQIGSVLASTNYNSCNFYITEDNVTSTSDTIVLAKTVDESTLINGKIAPGTSGSFSIIVNVENNVQADFIIAFDNFSRLPSNLKFYYNDEERNLKETTITDKIIGDSEQTKVYTINWIWEYATSHTNNKIDTIDGINLDTMNFNINLTTSYSSTNTSTTKVLPRTGDMVYNRRIYKLATITAVSILFCSSIFIKDIKSKPQDKEEKYV